MSDNWTREQIDEWNRKQAAQGFVSALHMLAGDPAAVERFNALTGPEAIALVKAGREGRIKGVAAESERTFEGRVYHSKAEARRACELAIGLKLGHYRRVTPQVAYPIIVNGVEVCKVVVDFEVEESDGSITALEVKGFQTELYRLKAKLLRACYPKLNYVVESV